MDRITFAAVLTVILVVLSIVAIIVTIAVSKKVTEETEHILIGLLPLEFCIIFFGTPFFFALCFFLV